jgi:hypothetical protein
MTLIGIATYGKYAEFITDELSYTTSLSSLGKTTKSRILSHIDTAVITQGGVQFGRVAEAAMGVLAEECANLDSLVADAPETLRTIWHAEPGHDTHDGTVFLVGYSAEREAFAAFAFCAERNEFEPEELVAPHVMPAPFAVAPSLIELDRLMSQVGPRVSDKYRNALSETWTTRPAFRAPRNKDEWRTVAKQCREQRALDPGAIRTLVGGNVHHTRISRGKSSTNVIHTYDDSGAEFQKMIAHSAHPQAQLGACPCDSGRTYRECCLVEFLDEACSCGSGDTFGQCCALDVAPPTRSRVN